MRTSLPRNYLFVRGLFAHALLGGSHSLGLDQVKPDPFDPGMEVEHAGCSIAEIHDAAAHIRPPVIDPDDDPLAVPQVGHLYISTQRKLAMGGGEFEHVEVVTAGGLFSVELLAVPGSASYLVRLRLLMVGGGFGFGL